MSEFLKYEQDGAVVTLTMNAPEVRNALTGNAAVDEFVAAGDHAGCHVRHHPVTAVGERGGEVERGAEALARCGRDGQRHREGHVGPHLVRDRRGGHDLVAGTFEEAGQCHGRQFVAHHATHLVIRTGCRSA